MCQTPSARASVRVRRPSVRRSSAWLASALVLASGPSLAAQVPLDSFLQNTVGLNAGQVRDASRGGVVVRLLDTKSDRDVVLFGIVTIGVPRPFYVERLKQFRQSLRQPDRTGFGVFGTPATITDVDSLIIPPADVALLHACRPGACDFKLPATDMARFRAILDSGGATASQQLVTYARTRIAEYVNGYRDRGGDAMIVYDDEAPSGVRASEAFAQLLAESPYIYDYVPAFHRYLLQYPSDPLDGVTEAIFWARDALPGLRATLTINHIAVYSPAEHPDATVVAIKQVFADHYFEAALDLLVALDRSVAPDHESMYLILLRQYRFDNLPTGMLGIRGRVLGKLKDRAVAELKRTKQDCEAAFKSSR